MKKILFVINTMGRAGAEKSMTELMKAIDKDKYELHLLSLINRGEMFDSVPTNVIIHNKNPDSKSVLSIGAKLVLYKTVFVSMIKGGNILKNLSYLLKNIREQSRSGDIQLDKLFWRIISEGTPIIKGEFDIAIAYLEGGASYYVANRVRAKKKISYIHIDYKKSGYTPLMDQGCFDNMDKLFIVSEDAKKSFLEVYPKYVDKVDLFYNIINPEEIRSLAKENLGFSDNYNGLRILTIGRLHYQKAYDIAIPVLSKLKKLGYNVRWYVIGEGSIRGQLEKIIKDYDVVNEFILLGGKENPYPYLKKADLYVHTTRFEGKSIAIEEAQVLGKAIVASDCTGNREQIEDGVNGLIVPLEVNEIVKGITKVIDNNELKDKFQQGSLNIQFDYRKNLDGLYRFMEA